MTTPKNKKTTSRKTTASSTKKVISSTKKPRLSPKQVKLVIVLAVVILGAGGYVAYSLYQRSFSDAASRGGSACSLDGSRIVTLENQGFYNGKTRLSGAGVKVVYDRYDKNSYCIKAWSSSGKKITLWGMSEYKRLSPTSSVWVVQGGYGARLDVPVYYKDNSFRPVSKTTGNRFKYEIKYGGKTYTANTSRIVKR